MLIEASIGGAWSWASPEQAMYAYRPKLGRTIGIDFFCVDMGVDQTVPVCHWGSGFETLHLFYVTRTSNQVRGNPTSWGLLRFEE